MVENSDWFRAGVLFGQDEVKVSTRLYQPILAEFSALALEFLARNFTPDALLEQLCPSGLLRFRRVGLCPLAEPLFDNLAEGVYTLEESSTQTCTAS